MGRLEATSRSHEGRRHGVRVRQADMYSQATRVSRNSTANRPTGRRHGLGGGAQAQDARFRSTWSEETCLLTLSARESHSMHRRGASVDVGITSWFQ